jgi:hypothetical protein
VSNGVRKIAILLAGLSPLGSVAAEPQLPSSTAELNLRNSISLPAVWESVESDDWTGIGDINGDGFDDAAINDSYYRASGEGRGRVLIYFGPLSTPTAKPNPPVDWWPPNPQGFEDEREILPDLAIVGPAVFFGSAVAGLGDFNGDGLDDFAIRSRFERYVYVIFGNDEGFFESFTEPGIQGFPKWDLLTEPLTLDTGLRFFPASESRRGVAGIGDINGDGFNELLLTDDDSFPNVAIIVEGSDDWTQVDHDVRNTWGNGTNLLYDAASTASGLGDINGDGLDDFQFGNSETINIIMGGPLPGFSSLDFLDGTNGFTLRGEAPYSIDGLAAETHAVGDLNGDGFDELVLADPSVDVGPNPYVRFFIGALYLFQGGVRTYPRTVNASVDAAVTSIL